MMPTIVAVTDVLSEKVRVEWTINDWRLVMRFSDLDDCETFGPTMRLKQINRSELRVSIAAISRSRTGECLIPQICLLGSEIPTNSVLVMGTIGLFGPHNVEYGGNKIDRRVAVGEVIAGAPVLKNKILSDKIIVVADLRITAKKADKYSNAHGRSGSHSQFQPDGDLCESIDRITMSQGHPDCIIRVGDATFKAHRVVLTSKSDVFKSLLEQAAKTKRKNTLDINNTNPEIWERFQNYLYTGQIYFNKDHLDDTVAMLILSEKYRVHSLTEELASKLKSAMTKYNVLDIFDIAEHFNLTHLEAKTQDFIRSHSEFFNTDKAEAMRKRIWNNPKLAELMFNRMQ